MRIYVALFLIKPLTIGRRIILQQASAPRACTRAVGAAARLGNGMRAWGGQFFGRGILGNDGSLPIPFIVDLFIIF